ncbi:hypothetical protein Scep_026792 [Stephania cephalantha]|uniref:EGF-like calcium-binding domain-containing protein n=1 Tax=Stephania cephalantha TaxID=152367 RepID=A0AAP0HNH9_9MAGN
MINSTSFNESTNLGYDLPSDGPFTYSTTHNKFTALGCDIFAFISYYNGDKLSGCASMCPAFGNIDIYNSSCLGVGCCSAAIPGGVKEFQVQAYSVNTQSRSWVSNTQACSYASIHDGEDKCKYISKHECGKHSECYDPDNSTLGYRCRCCQGFDGNPYLPNGCTDIDECKNGEATCAKEPSHNFSTTGRKFGAVCVNTPGSYICKCPDGTIGDGRREGVGCIPGHQFDYVRRRPTVLIVSIAQLVPDRAYLLTQPSSSSVRLSLSLPHAQLVPDLLTQLSSPSVRLSLSLPRTAPSSLPRTVEPQPRREETMPRSPLAMPIMPAI